MVAPCRDRRYVDVHAEGETVTKGRFTVDISDDRLDTPTTNAWRGAAMVAAIVAGLAAIALASRGVLIRRYLDDMFIVYDGQWRGHLGQVAHLDFPSPIGQAYYWPFRLLDRLGDSSAMTVIHANLLVAGLLGVAMALTLPRRLSPALLGLAAFAVIVLAIAPRDIDYLVLNYSYLAPYNRWSWAAWMVIGLIALLPPARARPLVDGIVIGGLMALLALAKINFLVGAVLVVVPALLLGRLRPIAGMAALLSFALVLAGTQVLWGNGGAYLDDLAMAIASAQQAGQGIRLSRLFRASLPAICYLAVIVGIFRAAARSTAAGHWLRDDWRGVVAATGVVVAGAVMSVQNHPKFEYGHGVVGVLIALEMVRRRRGDAVLRVRGILALAAAGLAMMAMDAASLATHTIETWTGRACRLPSLAGTPAEGLMSPPRFIAGVAEDAPAPTCEQAARMALSAAPQMENDRHEVQKLAQAMTLLRAHYRPGDTIFTLDFSNPFPFLFAGPPPSGALTWWDEGRNYSKAAHPPASRLIGSSTLILQVKPPYDRIVMAGDSMWRMYGRDVERDFTPIGETSVMRLWRRKIVPVQ